MPTHKKLALPTSAAVAQALTSLEGAAGGREGLLDSLLHAPETAEQQYVVGLLADPRNSALGLPAICEMGRISVGQLIQLLKEGKQARALVAAMDRIAAKLPEVAEDVMTRAVPHLAQCDECRGEGTVLVQEEGEDGKETETEKRCPTCQGHGQVPVTPTLERQKVALEIGGLLKRGGVTVNVNQQQATQFVFTSDARRDFRTATDRLLYSTQEPQVVEAEAEVIDES
jgi:hypothetical protein